MQRQLLKIVGAVVPTSKQQSIKLNTDQIAKENTDGEL